MVGGGSVLPWWSGLARSRRTGWKFGLLEAGRAHAVAPFLRGCAPTTVPDDACYSIGALVALHQVLDGDDQAVLIGHARGAEAAYGAAAFARSGGVMRFSINIPNFGDFADAETVARVAGAAEAAGWDALFVWDHVVHYKRYRRSFGDPWMLLTAAALATTRIKLGPMVTPVPRRRPQQLARLVSTLDQLSSGRVIFGAGVGGPIEDEYGSFGEPTDPRLLAERLDEGLQLLDRYWSGESVTHDGRHYACMT